MESQVDCPRCGGEQAAALTVEGYFSCAECGYDFTVKEGRTQMDGNKQRIIAQVEAIADQAREDSRPHTSAILRLVCAILSADLEEALYQRLKGLVSEAISDERAGVGLDRAVKGINQQEE